MESTIGRDCSSDVLDAKYERPPSLLVGPKGRTAVHHQLSVWNLFRRVRERDHVRTDRLRLQVPMQLVRKICTSMAIPPLMWCISA